MAIFAPRRTRVAASQTAQQIEGGSSVRIHGIYIEASANSQVTLLEGDQSTTIFEPRVLANDTTALEVPWLADNGLSVTTPANCTVLVLHGAPHA